MGSMIRIFKAVITAAVIRYGIIFPDNTGAVGATQFRFTGAALIQSAPATYLFRVKFAQQSGYYTTFFYDTNTNSAYTGDSTFFGCHPYPYTTGVGATGDTGVNHHWEISAEGHDTPVDLGGVDDNGNSTLVVKGVWYRQAVVITLVGGKPLIKFYYDLDSGLTHVISYQFANALGFNGDFSSPGLTVGSSPWTGYQVSESMNATFRSFQLYATNLSTTDIQTESANDTVDAAQTAAGIASIHYINQNIKPTDIADKSGNGHDPAWFGADHGTLYTG